ncbi:acetylxylan esterase [Amycolatopsis sp. NPDC059657]|uniref:poly(ethylene terephthalate) hydrolase family protein n=1 Tax=Amycolatopsis sp. NPDC059657 TaxID=3346899 RepID=UPI00366C9982
MFSRLRRAGVFVGAVALLVAATGHAEAVPVERSCPSVGHNWSGPGPFTVTEQQSGVGHTIFRPTNLGGCGKHPVILWGNGTFATPSIYATLLRHWASHGFIVAAANTTQSGSGSEMLAGLDYLTAQNAKPGSVFYGTIDTSKVGATGHSQGGGGAINAGTDARVDTTVPIEPGPLGVIGQLKGPMFILGGQFDLVVAPLLLVIPRYNAAGHIPAVYGELAGATHATPSGDGGGFRDPITAWFRYFLMSDQEAYGEFFGPQCGNCGSPIWSDFRCNAKTQAL